MDQRTGTERAVREMRSIILRSKRRFDVKNVEEDARSQAEVFNKVMQKRDHKRKEVGQDTVDALLKNILKPN